MSLLERSVRRSGASIASNCAFPDYPSRRWRVDEPATHNREIRGVPGNAGNDSSTFDVLTKLTSGRCQRICLSSSPPLLFIWPARSDRYARRLLRGVVYIRHAKLTLADIKTPAPALCIAVFPARYFNFDSLPESPSSACRRLRRHLAMTRACFANSSSKV